MLEKKEVSVTFKGGSGPSFRTEMKEGDTKQRIISNYEIFVFDEQVGIKASKNTEDQFVILYEDDRIKAVLRTVIEDGQKVWRPVNGLFCAVWCEKRKNKKNDWIRFLWFNTDRKSFQHFEIKTLGFEIEIIMHIFRTVLSCLFDVLNDIPVRKFIEDSSKEFSLAEEVKHSATE